MLPPKRKKAAKRSDRWRSQAHLHFVRSFHCSINGCTGMPIECAHVRIGSNAGIGQKPDDWRTVPLCSEHHRMQHTVGERTFWANYEANTPHTVEDLINKFCESSPRAREIAARRQELIS